MEIISNPEFINLQPLDINPLLSKCEIKVFYLGNNQNGSNFSKETALKMSKSLRGSPIVGHYTKDKEDFNGHGEKITLDDEGIHFEDETRPYGFVAPNAQVWFQKFLEDGEEREYMMTTGFLWVGQYPECAVAITESRPHSMKLYEPSVEGEWAKTSNSNLEFFIVSDAIFENLCILGVDVAPCFEGSKISSPEISLNFTKNERFINDMNFMVKQLHEILQGGFTNMEGQQNSVTEPIANTQESIAVEPATSMIELASAPAAAPVVAPTVITATEPVEPVAVPTGTSDVVAQYEALKQEHETLQKDFSVISKQLEELTNFKLQIEAKEKKELIDSFTMLTPEDKKEVTENINKYSLEDIKAKLAVIGFEKGVNFSRSVESTPNIVTTFTSVNNVGCNSDHEPSWLTEARKIQSEKN